MRNELTTFLLAFQFLTRIPVPSDRLYSEQRMAASVKYYPLVGMIVGTICAAFLWGSAQIFSHELAILIASVLGLLLTGAFHEDGLADTFDGIGGGLTKEKALAVMKDSRLGTYGTLALVSVLALKIFSLFELSLLAAAIGLILAHSLSRLSAVVVIATSRYVREEGTGKPVAQGVDSGVLIVAVLSCLPLFAIWLALLPALALLCAMVGLFVGHLAMRLFFERRLGGYTGDTLGAVQQLSELGFYLGLVAWL